MNFYELNRLVEEASAIRDPKVANLVKWVEDYALSKLMQAANLLAELKRHEVDDINVMGYNREWAERDVRNVATELKQYIEKIKGDDVMQPGSQGYRA